MDPLPDYMIDLLLAARDQTTLRTTMESTLADLFFEAERIQKIMIGKIMLEDSVGFERDSLIDLYARIKTVESNYVRVAALSDDGQHSAAIALLDSMLTYYKLSTLRANECTAMKDFYSMVGSVEANGGNMASLKSGDVSALEFIALNQDAGLAAQKARNVLCFHYQICYDSNGQPKSDYVRLPKNAPEEILEKLNTIAVYPNPTDQYTTIEYALLKAVEETRINIYDITGRIIESRAIGKNYNGQVLLDTRKYPNGLVIFEITQDGEKVSDGKFIVSH